MAPVVPKIREKPTIGRQIFDIVTSGMYDDPLMIYREYIQNSVDSIDQAVEKDLLKSERGQISITLDGHERSIVIQDNGVGLSNDVAHSILINFGCSPKEGKNRRGFRGIGRLGGLAYCDEMIFETRAFRNEAVAIVSWSRRKFDIISSDLKNDLTLQQTIQAVVSKEYARATDKTPDHFFKVTLRNVHRFHADILMNPKTVCAYLSQTAPVPYNSEMFSYTEGIEAYLSTLNDYKCYQILVNGKQIFKPYSDEIKVSTKSSDHIKEIQYFRFDGPESKPMALGWYAKTNFLGTLPSGLNIKGIRVRQGNIEIGGKHFLDDFFSEARFSGWQIGEIHVANNALKPNARRDGFEQSLNFEHFLEQVTVLCRHLSALCRESSNTRIILARNLSRLNQLEKTINDSAMYINKEHYEQAINDVQAVLLEIKKKAFSYTDYTEEILKRIDNIKEKVGSTNYRPIFLEDMLDGRRLNKYDKKSLIIHIAKIIVGDNSNRDFTTDVLRRIISDFQKPYYVNAKTI